MNRVALPALLTLALSCAALPAQAATTPQTPAILGTVPLAGVDARPMQAYTVGKGSPLNFTLQKAEYSVGRVVIGQSVVTPNADQKLLVLHFQVANPQKQDVYLNGQSLTFTAVDAQNTNRPAYGYLGRVGGGEAVGLHLKPSQKLDVFTVVVVPAAGPVPKLIVEREQGAGVLRYDLRQVAAPLAAPYADPGDKSGATALNAVPAVPGRSYPLENFDLRLETLSFSDEKLDGRTPRLGSRFLVATVLLKNQAPRESYLGLQTFMPEIQDADGERLRYLTVLKASRDEGPSQQIAPGAEYRVRYVFEVPVGAPLRTLAFQEGRAHALLFDVSQVR